MEFNDSNDLHLHQQSYHGTVNWRICEFCQGLVGKGTDYHEHVLSMHGSYNEKTQVFQTTSLNTNFKTGKLLTVVVKKVPLSVHNLKMNEKIT